MYTLHMLSSSGQWRSTSAHTMAEIVCLTMGVSAQWFVETPRRNVGTMGETQDRLDYWHDGGANFGRELTGNLAQRYHHAKRALLQRWMEKVDRSILLTRDERDEVRYALRYDSALLAIRRDVTDKLVRLGDLSLTRIQTSIYYLSPGLIEAYFAGEPIA